MISIKAEDNSVTLLFRNILMINKEVMVNILIICIGCLNFKGYSGGQPVISYNTCNFTLYQRELDKRHYWMEEILSLSGDFSEESNHTRGM
jgi:hypothetical protein